MMSDRYGPPDLTFTRRDWVIALAVIALAFAFRLVIIVDRAYEPHDGAFAPLPAGSDQRTYYSHIQGFRDGTFPPDTFWYQPGMSYFMIGASALMRTDDLGALRVLVAALASINCGLFIAVTRLALGRRDAAILAGVLLAFYPVGAFYDTDFVITSQATVLLTLALFGILWLWRSPRNWAGAVLYGLSFGALAVTRFEPVFLAPVFGLWLIAVRRDRKAVLQVALAAVVCVGVMLPVILHNRAGGADYLITPVGAEEIYRGNNRDTRGDYGGGQASRTTTDDFWTYLLHDIRLSPRRFVELVLHKAGMYLSPAEPGNNLNYALSGEKVSPLLRAVPLDFRILLILALYGLVILIRQRHPAVALLAVSFLVLMAAILTIWVEARLRTPTIVFMVPAAAYGIATLVEQFPVTRSGGAWAVSGVKLRRALAPIPLIVVVVALAYVAEIDLPRPPTVSALPATARPVGATYDNTLRLVGYEVQTEYSRAGIIEPFKPYVITFYWQLLERTSIDYGFGLAYIIDDQRVIGFDHPVGVVNYPFTPTSEWEPGTIYVEHVGLGYKRYDGPVGISGQLMLAVYSSPTAVPLLPAEGVAGSPLNLELTQPAIIWGTGALPDGLALRDRPVPFGETLLLWGWDMPTTARPGETVDVTLGWETTGVAITNSYALAVYVFDAAGQFTGLQADSAPQDGALLTTSLPEHYRFSDVKGVPLPSEPGTVTLYAGVYDHVTRDRLFAPDAAPEMNNLVALGTIEVR